MESQKHHNLTETFKSIIGNHIRKSRMMMGLTQEEAAERIGCSAKHLGRIERGRKLPSSLTLSLIHIKLNLSFDYLKEFKEVLKQFEHEN